MHSSTDELRVGPTQHADQKLKTFCGTPYYLAPEIVQLNKAVGYRKEVNPPPACPSPLVLHLLLLHRRNFVARPASAALEKHGGSGKRAQRAVEADGKTGAATRRVAGRPCVWSIC